MSILINDTQFSLLSGYLTNFSGVFNSSGVQYQAQIASLRNYTGISPTGIGITGHIPRFTNGGSGIENSSIFNSGALVGIGTGIMTANLSINGGAGQGTIDVVGVGGGRFRMGQAATIGAGFVGLEYNNPKFGITRSSNTDFILWYDTAIGHTVLNNVFGSSSNLKLKYVDADVLDINSLKNVGIGTTSPVAKLDVTGNIYASGINLTSFIIASGIVVSGKLPAAFNSPGYSGQIAVGNGFFYAATGNSLWGRVALSPW